MLQIGLLKRLVLACILASTLVGIVVFPAGAPSVNGPKMSKATLEVITGPTVQVSAMTRTSQRKRGAGPTAHILDSAKTWDGLLAPQLDAGLFSPTDLNTLILPPSRCTIIATPGFHFSYVAFNLRNYTLSGGWGAGYPAAYNKRCLLDPGLQTCNCPSCT